MKFFADRLLMARRNAGLRAKQLAASVGISPAYYSEIETGKKPPHPDLVKKFADLLGLKVDVFFDPDSVTGSTVAEPGTDYMQDLASDIWKQRALEAERKLAELSSGLAALADSISQSQTQTHKKP